VEGAELAPLCGHPVDVGLQPAVLDEELWGCRTCGACQQECPVYVEHIPKIVDMRRYLVMTESDMGQEARTLLQSLDDRMHPWVETRHTREDWFADLDVKVFGRGETAELLFWVGCTGALVDRNIEVTRAMVRILQAANVDFAVLGAEEVCAGDPARRVGGELTFQTCARKNIETFRRYGVQRILTTCPHCFNTFQNEYPDFGGCYAVTHHTQLIHDLIVSGRLKLGGTVDSLTYHDPCYLGRHNGLYDAPREILGALSGRRTITELGRNRSRSLCCGAGGGFAWMDDRPSKPINYARFEDVKASGAETVAFSCPFCLQTLEDAGQALDPERTIRTRDLAELVAETLDS
jgi:Fe-S oxidoreductase